ncbi:PREDICTED: 10-deacetylbaccatin III 10-O-acetyltransferase-like [Nelumbo nucifera]|uniref:10-deacetylbaccatin III 10-O-acetyltransferase-like n=2 Tax=Nelumbo nucifera TaxID=4432 RepID=A0A1U8AYB3_NELNU|nr:PREDICTED: 10-deacetylbaccatin III 10-O-acetyltransferase-like [Nelumbo nucifera]DAD45578.1 TPA_asm: hypothetical protein HUJ06_003808 [Nelumbo nucifera]
MTFSVIRSARSMVRPSGPTPSGVLDLSFIDGMPALRTKVRALHVFRHGQEAAKVISEALSKALVPYYPMAGRLKESSQGVLQISCTGEGIWFVQASANCSLETVNYFDNVGMTPNDKLLPDQPFEANGMDPLVQMQVTEFTCSGFVIGFIFCHAICDGLGMAQFLNAVGEFARGLQQPSVAPVWLREIIPTPPRLLRAATGPTPRRPPPPSSPPLTMPDYKLQHATIDISPDGINQLKGEFLELTGRTCSTFEVVAACLWSCRTRAIDFKRGTQVKLVYLANGRHLFNPPLPKGFYGNCFFPINVTVSSEALSQASIAEVIKLIQEARSRELIEFTKWLDGDSGEAGADSYAPSVIYSRLVVSEWGRLGLNQVDYGWGRPVHLVPIEGSTIAPVAIIGYPPTPKKGIRLMTWSVKGAHLPCFLEQMMNLGLDGSGVSLGLLRSASL